MKLGNFVEEQPGVDKLYRGAPKLQIKIIFPGNFSAITF